MMKRYLFFYASLVIVFVIPNAYANDPNSASVDGNRFTISVDSWAQFGGDVYQRLVKIKAPPKSGPCPYQRPDPYPYPRPDTAQEYIGW